MKYLYGLLCIAVLGGCASHSGVSTTSQVQAGVAFQEQVAVVQKKMTACVAEVNKTPEAMFVDSFVIAIKPNNPNAKTLFNSSELISDAQITAFKKFKDDTLQCRVIAKDFPSPELVSVYEYYYAKIDDVYADLINKKITIGVANQERAMRIHYANDKWAQIMQAQKGG